MPSAIQGRESVFTTRDLKVFESCLDRLVAARWLDRYVFSVRLGMTVQWTEDGRNIVGMLKRIIWEYVSDKSAAAVRQFDRICSDPGELQPTKENGIPADVASFWRDCLMNLNLTRDDVDFICLVRVLDLFGPEMAKMG